MKLSLAQLGALGAMYPVPNAAALLSHLLHLLSSESEESTRHLVATAMGKVAAGSDALPTLLQAVKPGSTLSFTLAALALYLHTAAARLVAHLPTKEILDTLAPLLSTSLDEKACDAVASILAILVRHQGTAVQQMLTV